jgi:hypothetical protein
MEALFAWTAGGVPDAAPLLLVVIRRILFIMEER